MKQAKKVVALLVFIMASILLLIPVSYALRPIDEANIEHRQRVAGYYAEKEESLNVVVLGSSAVYSYVNNPLLWEQTGLTSYNFAFPGLSIFALEDLIDEAEKTQSPELYIIDVRKFLFTEGKEYDEVRFQQLIGNIKYSTTRFNIINKIVEDPMERLNYYFDIVTYHGNWETFTEENLEYIDNEREHELKGWTNVTRVKEIEPHDVTKITEEVPLSEPAEETLVSILKKLKKEGKQALFVSTPCRISTGNQKQSNYTKSIVESYGFMYLDMNLLIDEMDIDFSTDFYNRNHVNAFGAEKVTTYLGEYLLNNYEFTEKTDTTVVESWTEAAKLNREEMEAAKVKKKQ